MADAETCTKTEAPFKTEATRGDIKATLGYGSDPDKPMDETPLWGNIYVMLLFGRKTSLKGADARNVAKLRGKMKSTFLASRDFKQKITHQKLTN